MTLCGGSISTETSAVVEFIKHLISVSLATSMLVLQLFIISYQSALSAMHTIQYDDTVCCLLRLIFASNRDAGK